MTTSPFISSFHSQLYFYTTKLLPYYHFSRYRPFLSILRRINQSSDPKMGITQKPIRKDITIINKLSALTCEIESLSLSPERRVPFPTLHLIKNLSVKRGFFIPSTHAVGTKGDGERILSVME